MKWFAFFPILTCTLLFLAPVESAAISQGQCQAIYNGMSWGGVDFPPATPRCDGASFTPATWCMGSNTRVNRVDLRAPTPDGWWRRAFAGNDFMCIPGNRVSQSFKRNYCAMARERSRFRTADGRRLEYWFQNERCMCAREGLRGRGDRGDCSVGNPFANTRMPQPQQRPQQQQARRQVEREEEPEERPAPRRRVVPPTASPAVRAQVEREDKEQQEAAERRRAQRDQARQQQAAADQAEQQAVATARECIDREFTERGGYCEESATAANNACRGTDENSTRQAGAVRQDSNNLVSAGAMRGAQQECSRAGNFAFGSHERITSVRDACASHALECRQTCGLDAAEAQTLIQTACEDEIGERPEVIAYLQEKTAAIGNATEESKALCEQANTKLAELNTLSNEIANATQSAARCACMLSSSGPAANGSCNSIPSIDACSEDPGKPGCQSYASMAVCSAESTTYDEQECKCLTAPGSPGCSGGASIMTAGLAGGIDTKNNETVSAFAGSAITNGAVGSSSGGAVNGAVPAGSSSKNFDLSSRPEGESSDPFNFSTSPQQATGKASANGAASNLPSGASAPGAAPAVATTAEQEAKDLGFFGTLKSFTSNILSNVFKGNGDSKSSTIKKVQAPDLARFKPRKIRGIASEEETMGLGKSNMNIWIMMNRCTGGESCRSNINNYITTP